MIEPRLLLEGLQVARQETRVQNIEDTVFERRAEEDTSSDLLPRLGNTYGEYERG